MVKILHAFFFLLKLENKNSRISNECLSCLSNSNSIKYKHMLCHFFHFGMHRFDLIKLLYQTSPTAFRLSLPSITSLTSVNRILNKIFNNSLVSSFQFVILKLNLSFIKVITHTWARS